MDELLAALLPLLDNARALLEQSRTEAVRGNLELISQLTEPMGRITGQLNDFARKSPLQLRLVSVRRASEALGMAKKTFYDKLHRLNLAAEDFR